MEPLTGRLPPAAASGAAGDETDAEAAAGGDPAAPPPPAFAPLRTPGGLLLRPLRAADAAALHRLVNDWEVARWLARVPFPYPRDLADAWIASTREGLRTGRAYHLAVADGEAEDAPLLGCAGLTLGPAEDGSAGPGEAELGYWIGRRHWGRGHGSDAAGRLARWALATLPGLDALVATALPDNPRSLAVLRRVGFEPDGEGEGRFLARGDARLRVLRLRATRESLARADAAATAAAPSAAPVEAPPEAGDDATALLLVAACALVDGEGRVLLARRPEGKPMAGLWEFPGGKLAPGETPEAALIRELREELGIDVSEACLAPFAFASHPLPDAGRRRHLLMPLYLCRRWEGVPTGREGQALAWVRPARLADHPMPPADRPLVALLRDFL